MNVSIWRLLGILALVACLVTPAQAQDAKCISGDYAWANNKEGKDPCQLANALVAKCNGSPFSMLPPNTAMYGGPGDNNECLCNLVEYNLLRMCAKCQNAMDSGVEEFPDWGRNCAKKDAVDFGPGAPGGVDIPSWARSGSTAGPWNLESLKGAAAPPPPPPPPPPSPQPQPQSSPSPSPSPPAESPKESEREEEPAETPSETSSQRTREPPEPTANLRQAGLEANEEPKQADPTPQESKRPDPSPIIEIPKSSNPPLRKLSPSKSPQVPEDEVDDPAPTSFERPVQPQRPVQPIQPILLSPLRKEPTPQSTHSASTQDDREDDRNDDNDGNRQTGGFLDSADAGYNNGRPTKQTSQFIEDLVNTRAMQAGPATAGQFTPKIKNPSTSSQFPINTMSLLSSDHRTSTDSSSLRGQYAGKAAVDLSALLIGSATQLDVAEKTQTAEIAPSPLDSVIEGDALDKGQKHHVDEDEQSRTNTASPSATGEAGFVGAGTYQYSGDPGIEVDESESGDSKTKVAIVCGTLAAVLVAAAVAFKLFMCFRKRKDIDDDNAGDDRESWMEPEADSTEESEKPKVVYPKGILGRQSVWDRIQRSLMPAISRASANPAPYPSFNPSAPVVQSAIPEQAADNMSDQSYTPAATTPRRSIWANIRKSFGPFSRPSFIPPTPTPNLAALRGLNKPDALRTGILKRAKAEAEFDDTQNSPVETLHYDDEEAIRYRDMYIKPLPTDITYAGGHQTEPRQWI